MREKEGCRKERQRHKKRQRDRETEKAGRNKNLGTWPVA